MLESKKKKKNPTGTKITEPHVILPTKSPLEKKPAGIRGEGGWVGAVGQTKTDLGRKGDVKSSLTKD